MAPLYRPTPATEDCQDPSNLGYIHNEFPMQRMWESQKTWIATAIIDHPRKREPLLPNGRLPVSPCREMRKGYFKLEAREAK